MCLCYSIHPIRRLFLHTAAVKEVWSKSVRPKLYFVTTMVMPLKASDTAGIGPLTLFYAVRTFVQAKNIIFFSKSNTNPDFFGKIFAKTQICHECVCFPITPAQKPPPFLG